MITLFIFRSKIYSKVGEMYYHVITIICFNAVMQFSRSVEEVFLIWWGNIPHLMRITASNVAFLRKWPRTRFQEVTE
jgi:hypothetical protein